MTTTPDESGRRTVYAVCLVLGLGILALYFPSLRHGYVLDDFAIVTSDPFIWQGLGPAALEYLFTPDLDHVYWMPLIKFSFMLEAQFFGLDPFWMHLTNIILHAGICVLLFLALLRMTGKLWASAAVAAVLALHPVHVEAVAYISSRKDVLSVFVFVLALHTYISYVRQGGWRWYLLTTLLLGVMFCGKSSMISAPCVLLLLDYWPLGRLRLGRGPGPWEPGSPGAWGSTATGRPLPSLKRVLLEKVPFLAMAGLPLFMIFLSMNEYKAGSQASTPLGLLLGNSITAYGRYMAKLVWPSNLAIFYPYPDELVAWRVAASVALVFGLSAAAVVVYRTRPWFAVGWFWFLGAMVPLCGIIQRGIWSAINLRYVYFPSIGLAILAVFGLAALWAGRRAPKWLVPACAALLVLMAWRSWVEQRPFENDETLYRHALEVTENNAFVEYLLGHHLVMQERDDEAVVLLESVMHSKRFAPKAYNEMGKMLNRQKRYAEALEYFKKGALLRPEHGTGYSNVAWCLELAGRLEEAEKWYRDALKVKADDPVVLYNLGNFLVKRMRLDEAGEYLRRSAEVRPHMWQTHYVLANLLFRLGFYEESAREFERTFYLNPRYVMAYKNAAALLLNRLGRREEARRVLQKERANRKKWTARGLPMEE